MTKTRTAHRLPLELMGRPAGRYSIHYYGEAEGTVQQWDGRTTAAQLVDQDQAEALSVGAADPETGETAAMEVLILEIDAEGDCWLLDSARLA